MTVKVGDRIEILVNHLDGASVYQGDIVCVTSVDSQKFYYKTKKDNDKWYAFHSHEGKGFKIISNAEQSSSTVLPQTFAIGEISQTVGGLTKRELFAAMCLQGIMANSIPGSHHNLKEAVNDSIQYTDALLAELEKTQNGNT